MVRNLTTNLGWEDQRGGLSGAPGAPSRISSERGAKIQAFFPVEIDLTAIGAPGVERTGPSKKRDLRVQPSRGFRVSWGSGFTLGLNHEGVAKK